MARMVLSGFLWVLPVAFWGCCSADPIATYPWVDAPTALRIMTQRGRSIQTLQAPDCTIRLTRADGESVRLDAVLVSRPPDYLRLRASKFGRVVIDLTLTPQGLWILESQDSAGASSGEAATANLKTVTARQLASAWSIFAGQQFDHPDLKVTDNGASTFMLTRQMSDQLRFIGTVDRATLTVQRYELIGADGATLSKVSLRRYRHFGSVVWPTRIVAQSDSGTVEISLHQIDFNEDLAPAVFTPPRRAVKQPVEPLKPR